MSLQKVSLWKKFFVMNNGLVSFLLRNKIKLAILAPFLIVAIMLLAKLSPAVRTITGTTKQAVVNYYYTFTEDDDILDNYYYLIEEIDAFYQENNYYVGEIAFETFKTQLRDEIQPYLVDELDTKVIAYHPVEYKRVFGASGFRSCDDIRQAERFNNQTIECVVQNDQFNGDYVNLACSYVIAVEKRTFIEPGIINFGDDKGKFDNGRTLIHGEHNC